MIALPFDLPGECVYVASAGGQRREAAFVASQIRNAGRKTVSSWHDLPPFDRSAEHVLDERQRRAIAAQCIHEVQQCDVLLAVGHHGMRGALFEAGLALGLGKRIVWVGDKSVSLFSEVFEGAWWP